MVLLRVDTPGTSFRSLQGKGVRFLYEMPNIGALFNRLAWVASIPPNTTSASLMAVDGLASVEDDVEHPLSAPRPFQRLRDLSARMLSQVLSPFPSDVTDVARQFPLGAEGLISGRPVDKQRFLDMGDVRHILDQVQAPQAWRSNKGESAIIVVVDTGVQGELVPAWQKAGGWTDIPKGDPWVDDIGHGSLVAMLAASDPDTNGYSGVAPKAKIFSLKPRPGPRGGITASSVLLGFDFLLGLFCCRSHFPLHVCRRVLWLAAAHQWKREESHVRAWVFQQLPAFLKNRIQS